MEAQSKREIRAPATKTCPGTTMEECCVLSVFELSSVEEHTGIPGRNSFKKQSFSQNTILVITLRILKPNGGKEPLWSSGSAEKR